MGAVLYSVWTFSMGVGVVAGAAIPPGLELTGAATFMMIGLLSLALTGRHQKLAATSGALIGAASVQALPGQIVPVEIVPILAAAVAAVMALRAPTPEPTAGSPAVDAEQTP